MINVILVLMAATLITKFIETKEQQQKNDKGAINSCNGLHLHTRNIAIAGMLTGLVVAVSFVIQLNPATKGAEVILVPFTMIILKDRMTLKWRLYSLLCTITLSLLILPSKALPLLPLLSGWYAALHPIIERLPKIDRLCLNFMLFLIMNYLMVATVFIIMRITGTEHLMRVAPGIGILLFSHLCLCCMLLPSAFDGILTSNHNKAKKKPMILISNL